jgi:hypothetical protein
MLRGNAADEGRLSTFSVLTEWARSAYVAAPLAGRAYLLVLLGLGLPTAFVASHKEHRPGGGSSYGLGRLSPLAVRNILLFNPWRLACMLSAIALGMLLVAVALWGVRPAVLIWLVGCMLIGGSLAAWRWYMLVRGRPSPQRCETEMLHD